MRRWIQLERVCPESFFPRLCLPLISVVAAPYWGVRSLDTLSIRFRSYPQAFSCSYWDVSRMEVSSMQPTSSRNTTDCTPGYVLLARAGQDEIQHWRLQFHCAVYLDSWALAGCAEGTFRRFLARADVLMRFLAGVIALWSCSTQPHWVADQDGVLLQPSLQILISSIYLLRVNSISRRKQY